MEKELKKKVEELEKRIAVLEATRLIQYVPYPIPQFPAPAYTPNYNYPCPVCGRIGPHTCVTC